MCRVIFRTARRTSQSGKETIGPQRTARGASGRCKVSLVNSPQLKRGQPTWMKLQSEASVSRCTAALASGQGGCEGHAHAVAIMTPDPKYLTNSYTPSGTPSRFTRREMTGKLRKARLLSRSVEMGGRAGREYGPTGEQRDVKKTCEGEGSEAVSAPVPVHRPDPPRETTGWGAPTHRVPTSEVERITKMAATRSSGRKEARKVCGECRTTASGDERKMAQDQLRRPDATKAEPARSEAQHGTHSGSRCMDSHSRMRLTRRTSSRCSAARASAAAGRRVVIEVRRWRQRA